MPVTISFTIHVGKAGLGIEWHDPDIRHDGDTEGDTQMGLIISKVLRHGMDAKLRELLKPVMDGFIDVDRGVSDEFAKTMIKNRVYGGDDQ